MLIANELERKFSFMDNGQDIMLADVDSRLAPKEILNFYANTYPVLTTATIEGPEINNDMVEYKFVTHIGTKG